MPRVGCQMIDLRHIPINVILYFVTKAQDYPASFILRFDNIVRKFRRLGRIYQSDAEVPKILMKKYFCVHGRQIVVKNARFDERLQGIIVEALHRLQHRMERAYFRGDLKDYLDRIGLLTELEQELDNQNFQTLRVNAQRLLRKKICRARNKGYLKDYMRRLNMVDLLMAKKRVRTIHLWTVPGGELGENDVKRKDDKVPYLRLIK